MSHTQAIEDVEIVVVADDFGFLVEEFIRSNLRDIPRTNIDHTWTDKKLRLWWPQLEDYYQNHIISAIEVAIALDEPPRYRDPLPHKEMWIKIVKDLRPARSEFTVKYHCSKCKAENVKLWRDYQTFASHIELECATCLAPELILDDKGKHEGECGPTDQMKGKVPAVPVGDTFWGYSSVVSQDLEWWINLPTYAK